MADQKIRILLAYNAGRFFQVLQRMPGLSEVRHSIDSSSRLATPDHQAMAVQRMGMDMIGQINPPTSKGHKWILAAMDYFTKWVEAVPMKNVTARDVVNFVKEHIVHRFDIPQTITTDQGTIFTVEEFKKFAKEMGISLIQSSPYYA